MAKVRLTTGRISGFECPAGKAQAFLHHDRDGLAVRATPSSKAFVFQGIYSGKDVRITIGSVQAWTIEQALVQCRELQRQIDLGLDPRQQKRQNRQDALSADEQAKAAKIQKAQASRFTVEALCRDYLETLSGKQSHADATGLLTNHLFNKHPDIASKPAKDASKIDFVAVLRSLHEAGKGRTANKLRSYMFAAFRMAAEAEGNPKTPSKFIRYAISTNPLSSIPTDKTSNLTDKNPLSAAELQDYWAKIETAGGLAGTFLRFHLLTGGQRVQQLARVKREDVRDGVMYISDPKGKRIQPRIHPVPLTARAQAELVNLPTKGYLFTMTGSSPIAGTSATHFAVRIAGKGFQIKRVRSGVETILSASGVSKAVRAQLQSHGITGVQDANYDGHDYMREKLEALELLESLVTNNNVTPIRRAA